MGTCSRHRALHPHTCSPQIRCRRGELPHSEDSPEKSSPAHRRHSSPRHLTLVSNLIHFPALAAGASRTQRLAAPSFPSPRQSFLTLSVHTWTHTETQYFCGEGSFPSSPSLAPCSRAAQLWGRGWRVRLVCSE